MAEIIDITGLKFGKLTALEPFGKTGGVLSWFCICDCGMYCFVTGVRLRRLERSSCRLYGCQPDTSAVVEFDSSRTMAKRPRKAVDRRNGKKKPEYSKEDKSYFCVASLISEKRKAYLDAISPGDTLRYRSNAMISGYLLAEVIKVSSGSFWVRSEIGERRIGKNLVVFYNGVQEQNHAAAIQKSV